MAEARCAVEPLPSLSLESTINPTKHHMQAHTSQHGLSIFIPHPRYIITNVVNGLRQLSTALHHAFMPLPLPVVFSVVGGTVAVVMLSPSSGSVRNGWLGNVLWNIDSRSPIARMMPTQWRVFFLTFNVSVGVIFSFTAAHRILLKGLLSYHGYMDAARGPKTLKTKVWGFLLKYLYIRGGSKVTMAYQSSLPTFPLPGLKETTERYLRGMEGIFDQQPEEREVVKALAQQFNAQEGPKLQSKLWWKHLFSKNYISDWWLDLVYLQGRESIMINSNYYGLSLLNAPHTTNQIARAAYVTYTLIGIMEEMGNEQLPPTMMQGLVPLCMQQFTMAFSTTRIPLMPQDLLEHTDPKDSRHIVVLHKGRYYRVKCFSDTTGRRLSYMQLYETFSGIIRDESVASELELKLGAFTAWNRNSWAESREKHFLRHKLNRAALEVIEKAMWFTTLDLADEAAAHDDLTSLGRIFMHGTGCNRWFDKSFSTVFCVNGYFAMNGEHSWADAPCLGQILETTLAREVRLKPYLANGTLKPDPTFNINEDSNVYAAERLQFQSTPELLRDVRLAADSAVAQIADLDLVAKRHAPFGKGKMKKSGVSPDAFIQLALQVAFYRDQRKFVQTYESSLARLYVEGRTETIRACTKETCDFTLALESGKVSNDDLQKLCRTACSTHTRNTALSMTGRGVDRHLFALYVVAKGTQTESPFLNSVMGRGWKLSTSQVPTNQTEGEWLTNTNGDEYPRPSGGFGPVADDGYGVSYAISGEDNLFFHVSSKKHCPTTDSTKMMAEINKALGDIAALF